MKLRHLFSFVTIVAVMASCSKEEIGDNVLTNFVLKASVENSAVSTRAGFESDGKFYWSKNDKLGVTTTSSQTDFTALTLQGDGGTATGSFSGDIYGAIKGYAVYPHNSNHKMDNEGNLTYMFPATYEYSSVDKEYFHATDQGKANSFNFAMWGKIINGGVGMKHLGGVFMVAFTSMPAEGTFILSAEQKINGTYSVNLNSEVPEIKLAANETPTDAEKKVTISYKNAAEGQTGVFYVPAPTGNYTGVKATLLNSNGETVKEVACGNIEIVRTKGKVLNFTNGSITGGGTTEVGNANAANVALENENITSVKIAEVAASDEITIPAKSDSDLAAAPHTIDLSNATLPSEGTITINVSEGNESAKTVNQLTVVISSSTEEATGSLQINAPGTTVTIQAADGTVIKTIEATTADNTLIVGEGVTIENLKIKKGNVELYGNVENITSEVATTIKLMKDITLQNSMTFSEGDVTVNLNDKSIKCASSDVFVVTAGTLTIEGKGLVYGSEDDSSSSCAVWAKGTGKVIINGGTYKVGHDGATKDKGESSWRNDCIYARDNAEIIINGGEFEYTGDIDPSNWESDGNRFLVNQNDKCATRQITIYGGTFHKFDPANAHTDESWMTDGVGSFVATGYSSVAGGNDTYVVKEGIYNETALKAAIAAGNTEVTLGANIDLASSVEISSNLTVNLNGKSIKCASTDVFVVTAGTLTINGSGTVYGSYDNSSSSCAVWAKENGTVIINGGTYMVGHDGASKEAGESNWRNDCIYARDNAHITINGGEFKYTGEINETNFESDGNRFLLNCRNDDYQAGRSSITVTGGTFHKFNPGATYSENPVANYVAVGYSSVAGENDTYVVTKAEN